MLASVTFESASSAQSVPATQAASGAAAKDKEFSFELIKENLTNLAKFEKDLWPLIDWTKKVIEIEKDTPTEKAGIFAWGRRALTRRYNRAFDPDFVDKVFSAAFVILNHAHTQKCGFLALQESYVIEPLITPALKGVVFLVNTYFKADKMHISNSLDKIHQAYDKKFIELQRKKQLSFSTVFSRDADPGKPADIPVPTHLKSVKDIQQALKAQGAFDDLGKPKPPVRKKTETKPETKPLPASSSPETEAFIERSVTAAAPVAPPPAPAFDARALLSASLLLRRKKMQEDDPADHAKKYRNQIVQPPAETASTSKLAIPQKDDKSKAAAKMLTDEMKKGVKLRKVDRSLLAERKIPCSSHQFFNSSVMLKVRACIKDEELGGEWVDLATTPEQAERTMGTASVIMPSNVMNFHLPSNQQRREDRAPPRRATSTLYDRNLIKGLIERFEADIEQAP